MVTIVFKKYGGKTSTVLFNPQKLVFASVEFETHIYDNMTSIYLELNFGGSDITINLGKLKKLNNEQTEELETLILKEMHTHLELSSPFQEFDFNRIIKKTKSGIFEAKDMLEYDNQQ